MVDGEDAIETPSSKTWICTRTCRAEVGNFFLSLRTGIAGASKP